LIDRLVVANLQALVAEPERLDWKPLRPGIDMHRLYDSGQDGPAAAFLRYQPGATLARHRHTGLEHVFVLAGSQQDERGVYPAGALVMNPPGSAHSVASVDGCIVLVLWEKPVSFEPG
jgi:anti-sigma factor ChrR (cupin superfamily)